MKMKKVSHIINQHSGKFKRKMCSLCPISMKRKTFYYCIGCKTPIFLQ